jgi:ubiquitin conjugation factor E4 B
MHIVHYFANKYIVTVGTAINASSEEVSSLIESMNKEHAQNTTTREDCFVGSQEATSSDKNGTASLLSKGGSLSRCSKNENFSFICECFFMTARVLNLGLMKALSDFKHIAQVWRYHFFAFLLFLRTLVKIMFLI